MIKKFFNLDRCAPDAEAHFILFNRGKGASWDEKLWAASIRILQLFELLWDMKKTKRLRGVFKVKLLVYTL